MPKEGFTMLNTIPVTVDIYIVIREYVEEDGGVFTIETVVFGRENAERVYLSFVDAAEQYECYGVILADACIDNHGCVTEDQYINHWIYGRGETLRDGRETRRVDTSPISYDWVPAED
jgi:hypothetical protein